MYDVYTDTYEAVFDIWEHRTEALTERSEMDDIDPGSTAEIPSGTTTQGE